MKTHTSILHSPSASTQDATTAADRVLATAFVDAFKSEFLQPPGTVGFIWPAPGSTSQVIAEEFGTFMEVLLLRQRVLLAPATPPGNTLRGRVIQFVTDQKWPKPAGPQLPAEWAGLPGIATNGRLAEISLICTALLDAARVFGGGGSPGTIPPHGP